VRSQGQAPKGRHKANQMCRPFGAVNDHAACPTVSTVGYVVTSLRDFEQHNRRTSDINIDRKFLGGRLLVHFEVDVLQLFISLNLQDHWITGVELTNCYPQLFDGVHGSRIQGTDDVAGLQFGL
jgi:hypothetical protein